MENKNFSVKSCLLAFNIVALEPVVSLELFVTRAYVASYHAYHIYPRPFTVGDSFTSRKIHVSVEGRREVLMFISSINLIKLMFLEFDE